MESITGIMENGKRNVEASKGNVEIGKDAATNSVRVLNPDRVLPDSSKKTGFWFISGFGYIWM